MATQYDYVKHAITDRHDGEVQFADADFSLRLGRAMGGRLMLVMCATSVGLMFTVPGVGFVLDGGRQLAAALMMVGGGAVLLYIALYRALERRTLQTRGEALWMSRGPLFVAKRELAAVHEIADVEAVIAPYSAIERLTASSRATNDAYRPWTIALLTSGNRIVLPLRMRPEHARALATALLDALEERKRRIAARGGYRG